MSAKIWIIEDDPEIQHFLITALHNSGFMPTAHSSAIEALQSFQADQPDLVLLDIQLPDIDGFECCRSIRLFSNVPIIFVSCLDDGSDIIHGLELGGDDYITKPFDLYQLIARIKSNLRRAPLFNREFASPAPTEFSLQQKTNVGPMEMDFGLQRVTVNGQDLQLSNKEFQILIFLALNPDRIFSANELYTIIWGTESLGETRTLKVHISHLRKKMESCPGYSGTIRNVRGLGYQIFLDHTQS